MEYADFLIKEMNLLGLKRGDRIIHFGACDNGLNILPALEKNNKSDIFYLGIDPSEKIKNLEETYTDRETYAFKNTSMQEFLDDTYHIFEYTLITGIFDKPIYEEKQYIFISTVIQKCFEFAYNIIFTIDVEKYRKDYNFSILYVINNLINEYDLVNIKKVSSTKYIFSITH